MTATLFLILLLEKSCKLFPSRNNLQTDCCQLLAGGKVCQLRRAETGKTSSLFPCVNTFLQKMEAKSYRIFVNHRSILCEPLKNVIYSIQDFYSGKAVFLTRLLSKRHDVIQALWMKTCIFVPWKWKHIM